VDTGLNTPERRRSIRASWPVAAVSIEYPVAPLTTAAYRSGAAREGARSRVWRCFSSPAPRPTAARGPSSRARAVICARADHRSLVPVLEVAAAGPSTLRGGGDHNADGRQRDGSLLERFTRIE
jgi:hypothetical protein